MSSPSDPRTGQAVAWYHRGHTTREIAAHLGCEESTVRRLLHEVDLPLRRTGPRGRIDVTTEEILELRGCGLSWHAVAAEVGMSYTGVRHRARRGGEDVSC